MNRFRFGHFFTYGLAGVGMVLLIMLLIVPIPPFILDIMVGLNLAAAIILPGVVLGARGLVQMTSLPPVVLLLILSRLVTAVAATKQILSRAYAGGIIQRFGESMVAANMIAGAIVFLILVLLVYLIIAKGAERMAEVAARFSLDAMPGMQLGIDADLRSGAISQKEAMMRREALARESHLCGAMDGMMKLVKGDILAGLIIPFVTFFGGFAVAVLHMGMDAPTAAARFAVLSIGNALSYQIPAIFIAVTLGIVISRYNSEAERDHSLLRQMGKQLFLNPYLLYLPAGFFLILAVIPGFPTVPLLLLAALFAGLSYVRIRYTSADRPWERSSERPGTFSPSPLGIVVSRWNAKDVAHLRDELDRIIHDAGQKFGFPLHAIPVRRSLEGEGGHSMSPSISLYLNDVPYLTGRSLKDLPIAAIEKCVIDHLHLFVSRDSVDRLIRDFAKDSPVLAKDLLQSLSENQIVSVLRRLLVEKIALKPLHGLLETLIENRNIKNVTELAQTVREHLKETITYQYGAGKPRLKVIYLEPMLEDIIRDGLVKESDRSYLAMEPDMVRDIREAINRAAEILLAEEPMKILMVPRDIRCVVQSDIIGDKAPVVLSPTELLPTVVLESAGFVQLAPPALADHAG